MTAPVSTSTPTQWASVAYRFLALSEHPVARAVRRLYRTLAGVSVPAPRWVFRPLLLGFLALRGCYHFLSRVFFCEPLFKAYCTRYGRRMHTGVFLHWVQGSGDIILGDDVEIDGKCAFTFAARFSERPTLEVGDRSGIGHGCCFVIADRVSIGRDCRIAAGVQIFDSSGHPSDPELRRAGAPPSAETVRPVTIADNVWIGRGSYIFPGVTVGQGSIVAAGSVVMSDVPPLSVVAGNPARRIGSLEPKGKEQQV